MILNLIFDLGGVIMDIKKDNCVEAFRQLGLKDSSKFFGDYGQHGPFLELEEGTIDVHEFHKYVRSLLPADVTDRQIDDAFMKFLIGIPVHRLRQLQLLRQNYGVYLLSNTNPIMWDGKIASDFKEDGLDINGYFDGIVTSFTAKCLKPKPGIFEYLLDKYDLKAEECLFLDDSKDNVEAAIALGLRGAHVPEGKEFMDILKELDLVK